MPLKKGGKWMYVESSVQENRSPVGATKLFQRSFLVKVVE
jgi:hypothetical protein